MKKIIMIGMNPRTRDRIPWDDDAEFWTMNEGPAKDWMKRYDVLFQIHPRWDWDRSNNLSDPNHPLYIKGLSTDCLYCKGSGKAYAEGVEVVCPWCVAGHYTVPGHRKGKRIVMQDKNDDVPGCVFLPIEKLTQLYTTDGVPYFTSTLAHMLIYAIDLNMKLRKRKHPFVPIELYGFEGDAEYAIQRPCIEHWVGYGRGLGMSIEAPGAHLLTGRHYGYEDFDQGLRSRYEFRRRALEQNLNEAETEWVKSEGVLTALTPFKDLETVKPAWEQAFDDHDRKGKFVAFIRGTIKELDHAVKILLSYRQDSDEATQADVRRLIEIPYQLG